METFFTILGAVSTIVGIVFLFFDIKGKHEISKRAAVLILLGILIIVICAFLILKPTELQNPIGNQTTEGSDEPSQSDLGETEQGPTPSINSSNQLNTPDLDDTSNNAISASGTVTSQLDKSDDNTGNSVQSAPITVYQVTLDYGSLELTIGNTTTLLATAIYSNGTSDHSVTWLSSNPSVATVDPNGKITALSAGTTKITAQASRNNTIESETCDVTVSDPPHLPTGYSIRLSTDHALMGEAFRLYVTPYEDDITEIHIYTISPSGELDDFPFGNDGKYEIDTEAGTWTIYASVTNDAGTYMAQRTEDYVTIEIISTSDALDNLFEYLWSR